MFRKLEIDDYHKGYLHLLSQLTDVGNVNYDDFSKFVNNLNDDHQVWVFCPNDRILVTGTILKEQKLIHGFSKYGHIEEIVVDDSLRGQGYGKKIIQHLLDNSMDCYRINLSCKPELCEFYQKCGFEKRSVLMTRLNKN